jgi:IS5 family transposase
MQLGLSEDRFERIHRATRRQVLLSEMDQVVPWSGFEELIRPHYPAFGRGRQPYPLSSMRRVHRMQQWFGYADAAMEEALIDQPLLRRFAGLDAGHSLPAAITGKSGKCVHQNPMRVRKSSPRIGAKPARNWRLGSNC